MPPHPITIDEVLTELDKIVDQTIEDNNFLGIFAYVYRRTTAEIKQGIEDGIFEDNSRMEQFDVEFANLYIDAFYKFHEGEVVSKAWAIAFESADTRLSILQHLLLGMNSHINEDLAIAAATIMKGKSIEELEADFMKVNDILAGLVDELQGKISRVSRLMFLLDWVGALKDEKIVSFSITKARVASWSVSREIWSLEGMEREIRIRKLDERVNELSRLIINPPSFLVRNLLDLVKFFETRDVRKIVASLQN